MNAKRVVQGFAVFDLAVTGLFAVPGSAILLLDMLDVLDRVLVLGTGFGGAINQTTLAFANIMGVLGVIWAMIRLKSPSFEMARIDAWGRLAVALILIWHLWAGLPMIFALFVATELIGTAAQLALRRENFI